MVKPENYITIQGWMRTELDLKGNELNLYAIIYGFAQDGETEFSGSVRYMQEWLGADSKQTVFNTLDKLIKKGLIQKRTEVANGVKRNYYLAVSRGSPKFRLPQSKNYTEVVQNLDHPSPKFRPNNIEDNIEDILVIKDNGGSDPRLDADFGRIVRAFEENIGSFPPIMRDSLQRWREQFSTEMILLAIAEGAKNGAHRWNYIDSILRGWKKNNIRTPGDFEAWESKRKSQSSDTAAQQPNRSAAADYDFIFGGLNDS